MKRPCFPEYDEGSKSIKSKLWDLGQIGGCQICAKTAAIGCNKCFFLFLFLFFFTRNQRIDQSIYLFVYQSFDQFSHLSRFFGIC